MTVEDIANEVGVTRNVLTRIFHNSSGQSLGWRLRERRLRRAMSILTKNDMTEDEVARHCGYANDVALRRALKQRFGHLPSDLKGR